MKFLFSFPSIQAKIPSETFPKTFRRLWNSRFEISSQKLALCSRGTPGRGSRDVREIWGTTCSGRFQGCARIAPHQRPSRAARAASRAFQAEVVRARRHLCVQEAITVRYPAKTGTPSAQRLLDLCCAEPGHWSIIRPALMTRKH